MSKVELLARLIELQDYRDPDLGWDDKEVGHMLADQALLEYIDDPKVEAAFERIEKWYS